MASKIKYLTTLAITSAPVSSKLLPLDYLTQLDTAVIEADFTLNTRDFVYNSSAEAPSEVIDDLLC